MIKHELTVSNINADFIPEIQGEYDSGAAPDIKVIISTENKIGMRNLFLVESLRSFSLELASMYAEPKPLYLESRVFHVGFFDSSKGSLLPNEEEVVIGDIQSIVATVLNKK